MSCYTPEPEDRSSETLSPSADVQPDPSKLPVISFSQPVIYMAPPLPACCTAASLDVQGWINMF